MQYTSAQANKLLKQLMEERDNILYAERQSKDFVAATTEKTTAATNPPITPSPGTTKAPKTGRLSPSAA